MIRYLIATTAVLLATSVQAALMTYDFVSYPADQNGHELSGAITTDGTLGALSVSNIVDASVIVSGPKGFSFELVGASILGQASGVVASPTEITVAEETFFVLANSSPISFGSMLIVWDRRATPNEYKATPAEGVGDSWLQISPAMGGTDPWVVANNGRPVPEPSTLAVFALGGIGIVAGGIRRRRKQNASRV